MIWVYQLNEAPPSVTNQLECRWIGRGSKVLDLDRPPTLQDLTMTLHLGYLKMHVYMKLLLMWPEEENRARYFCRNAYSLFVEQNYNCKAVSGFQANRKSLQSFFYKFVCFIIYLLVLLLIAKLIGIRKATILLVCNGDLFLDCSYPTVSFYSSFAELTPYVHKIRKKAKKC